MCIFVTQNIFFLFDSLFVSFRDRSVQLQSIQHNGLAEKSHHHKTIWRDQYHAFFIHNNFISLWSRIHLNSCSPIIYFHLQALFRFNCLFARNRQNITSFFSLSHSRACNEWFQFHWMNKFRSNYSARPYKNQMNRCSCFFSFFILVSAVR